MAREELIASAVSFLQDPSVSLSPLEKRIAFLKSKNLTREEIDLALARADENASNSTTTSLEGNVSQQQPVFQSSSSPPQGYGYPSYGPWQHSPPELPRRDWRDWFIMATLTGGVGYGLYFLIKRYIAPLIVPPTPSQLQQDKQTIDEQFTRAFALIEQLANDTAALKLAEESRTERLDAALREVESVVSELKTTARRKDDDTRKISNEVRNLKESIPRALEGAKEGNETRLRELGTELRSLKVLMGNRLGAGSGTSGPTTGRMMTGTTLLAASRASDETLVAPTTINGISTTPQSSIPAVSPSTPPSGIQTASGDNNSNTLAQLGRSASIPSWQMSAVNKPKSISQAGPSNANDEQRSPSTS